MKNIKSFCKGDYCCKPLSDKEKLACAVVLGVTVVAVGTIVIINSADRIKTGMDVLKYKMDHLKKDIIEGLKKTEKAIEEEAGSITIELRRGTDEVVEEAEALIAELRKRLEKAKAKEEE
jgi:hypothetical protein